MRLYKRSHQIRGLTVVCHGLCPILHAVHTTPSPYFIVKVTKGARLAIVCRASVRRRALFARGTLNLCQDAGRTHKKAFSVDLRHYRCIQIPEAGGGNSPAHHSDPREFLDITKAVGLSRDAARASRKCKEKGSKSPSFAFSRSRTPRPHRSDVRLGLRVCGISGN